MSTYMCSLFDCIVLDTKTVVLKKKKNVKLSDGYLW